MPCPSSIGNWPQSSKYGVEGKGLKYRGIKILSISTTTSKGYTENSVSKVPQKSRVQENRTDGSQWKTGVPHSFSA